jgi:hypothetical protein
MVESDKMPPWRRVLPDAWLSFNPFMPGFVFLSHRGDEGVYLPLSKLEVFLREALAFCRLCGSSQSTWVSLCSHCSGTDIIYKPDSNRVTIEVDTSEVLHLELWELVAILSGLQALVSETTQPGSPT